MMSMSAVFQFIKLLFIIKSVQMYELIELSIKLFKFKNQIFIFNSICLLLLLM